MHEKDRIRKLMKIIVIFISILLASCTQAADTFDYREYSTLIRVDGKNIRTKCPKWDWLQVPAECRMPGFNCVPVCGKWPGDKVDIGAMQYIPGQTPERPWGIWKGIPFKYVPGEINIRKINTVKILEYLIK